MQTSAPSPRPSLQRVPSGFGGLVGQVCVGVQMGMSWHWSLATPQEKPGTHVETHVPEPSQTHEATVQLPPAVHVVLTNKLSTPHVPSLQMLKLHCDPVSGQSTTVRHCDPA